MKTKQKVILYVDDDPDDREFLCDAIRKKDPEVAMLLAENGLDALNCLTSLKMNNEGLPSLIVLDINMPFLDGLETYFRIRKEETLKHVPVIVFSSSEKPSDIALFNNLGIEYFSKPTDFDYFNFIAGRMVDVAAGTPS